MKYKAYIAIDWSDSKHDVCEYDGRKKKLYVVKQTAKAIKDWLTELKAKYGKAKIAVAFEKHEGALLNVLSNYNNLVLFPIHASTVSEYRKVFTPSGAKDDPTDAACILDLLLRHSDKFTAYDPELPETRRLIKLVEDRRVFVNDRKRLGNRLTSILKKYYPLALELFPKMGRKVLLEFIISYPSLQHLQAASDQEITKFFREHRAYRISTFAGKLDLIRKSIDLSNDQVVLDTSSLQAKSLAEQILSIVKTIEIYDEEIEKYYKNHPNFNIFNSLPAAGNILAPRLLAILGTKDKFNSALELQQSTGIAPVTVRSGKQEVVRWRFQCDKFTRQSFHEWSGSTVNYCLWAKAFYAMQRSKGYEHATAVRKLAFKWQRIIFKMWKENQTYDEKKYLNSLIKNNSPLIKFMKNPKIIDKAA